MIVEKFTHPSDVFLIQGEISKLLAQCKGPILQDDLSQWAIIPIQTQ